MIGGGDTWGAGEPSVDRGRLSKRAIEFGCLWAEQDERRHLGDAGKVRGARIIGDHARGDAIQQGQIQQSQGPGKIDTTIMPDVLGEDFRFLPLTWGSRDQDQHVGMLVQNLLDESDVFFRHPASLWEQFTGVGVDQHKGMLARMIKRVMLLHQRLHTVLVRDRIMDSL